MREGRGRIANGSPEGERGGFRRFNPGGTPTWKTRRQRRMGRHGSGWVPALKMKARTDVRRCRRGKEKGGGGA